MNVEFIKDFLGHTASIYCLAQGFNEGEFFSAGSDKKIILWNTNTTVGKVIATTEDVIFSITVDPLHKFIFCGSENGYLYRIDLNESPTARKMAFHRKPVYALQIVDTRLFAIAGDGILSEYHIVDFSFIKATKIFSKGLRSMVFLKEHNCLIIGAQQGMLFKYHIENNEVIASTQLSTKKTIFSLANNTLENEFYTGGMDALIRVFEFFDFSEKHAAINAHWYTINDLIFISEYNLLISASRDRKIRLWNLADFSLIKEISHPMFSGHLHSVNKILWLGSSNTLLSASDDRTIKSWRIEV